VCQQPPQYNARWSTFPSLYAAWLKAADLAVWRDKQASMRRGCSIRRPGLLRPRCGNAHWHRQQGLPVLAEPRRAFPVIGRALKSVGTRADLRRRRGRATPISVGQACTYQGDVSVSARSEWNRACARCRTTTSTVARSAAQQPSRLARRPAATGAKQPATTTRYRCIATVPSAQGEGHKRADSGTSQPG
jgi:hypothetical protein